MAFVSKKSWCRPFSYEEQIQMPKKCIIFALECRKWRMIVILFIRWSLEIAMTDMKTKSDVNL